MIELAVAIDAPNEKPYLLLPSWDAIQPKPRQTPPCQIPTVSSERKRRARHVHDERNPDDYIRTLFQSLDDIRERLDIERWFICGAPWTIDGAPRLHFSQKSESAHSFQAFPPPLRARRRSEVWLYQFGRCCYVGRLRLFSREKSGV